MIENINQVLAELDAQEAEVEQNFKNAISAYFESKAAIKGARQVLDYVQRTNAPQEGDTSQKSDAPQE